MKIGFDVDGVLADFNKEYIQLFKDLTGKNLFPAEPFDIPCWDYPAHYGYTGEETGRVWGYIQRSANYWERLPEYEDTQTVMVRISSLMKDHEVYFITDRKGPTAKHQTEKWLYERLPALFPAPTVLISKKKGVVARGLELDAYIDDRPDNVWDVRFERGLGTKLYVMDRPWNRDEKDKIPYTTRVTSVIGMLQDLGV